MGYNIKILDIKKRISKILISKISTKPMDLITKIIIIFICLVLPEKTQAYLDPGTGSYIFQLIIGALLGGLFMIKIFFRSIKLFFINLFAKTKNNKNNGEHNKQ